MLKPTVNNKTSNMSNWSKDEFNSSDGDVNSMSQQSGDESVGSSVGSSKSSSFASGTGRSSTRTGGESDDDTNSVKDVLAKQETKQVFRLRIAVVLILVLVATSISLAVYFLTRNAEIEEFDAEYEGIAVKIIEHFQEIMVEMSAVSGLAVAATTHAMQVKEMTLQDGNDVDWPFVSLPNFQQTARNVRGLSGAIYVSINPIVERDQLPLWESVFSV